MCDFPSWIEVDDGTVLFLTDKDARDNSIDYIDAVGHHGIRKAFPQAAGKDCEWFPCPPGIASAINRGKMNEIMRSAGIKYVRLSSNRNLHCADGPAVEWANGHKDWYLNGKRHRADGPAIEWADGDKEWYLNGKRHGADGPAAVERANGHKEWYLNGKRHPPPK